MAIDWFSEIGPKPADSMDLGRSPAALDPAADRLHEIVQDLEDNLSKNWNGFSTQERQNLLLAIAQAKQAEVLLSARVVKPEDALGHRHNSLVANTAQAIVSNSIKVDEAVFKRQQSSKINELWEKWHAEKAARAGRRDEIGGETISVGDEQ